jgi:SET domain
MRVFVLLSWISPLWFISQVQAFCLTNDFAQLPHKVTHSGYGGSQSARWMGEGGDAEWMRALLEAGGTTPGEFEQQMKLKGLLGKKSQSNPKLSENAELVRWLETAGKVYLSETSSWGEAPHPMAISTDTRDEITNEVSGRGLLARRDIKEGDELLKIPLKLCLTKKSAQKALGEDALPSDINEYLAIACQLIHEKYVMREKSICKAYIGVLPEVNEVNPTFAWSDEDLAYLEGSPVIAATRSMQNKLRREYDALLGGEDALCSRFPDRFPKVVRKQSC